MTLREALVELGVYVPPRRGKQPTYDPEEARKVQKQQCKVAQQAIRAQERACKEAGVEPPKRKRGRPPIYATREEARAVSRVQNAECRRRWKERLSEALLALKPKLEELSLAERARSNDQEKYI